MDSTGAVTVSEFAAGVSGLLDRLDCGSAVLLADRDQWLFPDEGVAHVARRAGASVAG